MGVCEHSRAGLLHGCLLVLRQVSKCVSVYVYEYVSRERREREQRDDVLFCCLQAAVCIPFLFFFFDLHLSCLFGRFPFFSFLLSSLSLLLRI